MYCRSAVKFESTYFRSLHWIPKLRKKRVRLRTYVFRNGILQGKDPVPNINSGVHPPREVALKSTTSGFFKVLDPVSVTTCTVDITFKVPFRVEIGESIAICGSGSELGNWKVQNAFPLTWTPGNLWTGELQLAVGTYEFKCVRVRVDRTEDEWEPGDNRVLEVQGASVNGGEMDITLDFGHTTSSNTIQIIRETVVMDPKGNELFRVSGGTYNLIRLEQLFQPMSIVNNRVEDDHLEEDLVHDVASTRLVPSIATINQYLRSVLLLDDEEITHLYRKYPNLRFKSIELDIKPWVQFFLVEVGMTHYHVATLIKRKPTLLDLPIKDVLHPFAEFFMNDLGVLSDKLFTFLKRRPNLLLRSLEKEIKPKVKTLKMITELEDWDIGRIIVGCSSLLSLSDIEIRQRFYNLTNELDLDVHECTTLVLRFPPLLAMKPASLSKKISYLTRTLKRSVNEIVGFPFCLSFSLERRIMKRFQHLQTVGFPHNSYSLPMVLSPSDKCFHFIIQKELNKHADNLNNEI